LSFTVHADFLFNKVSKSLSVGGIADFFFKSL